MPAHRSCCRARGCPGSWQALGVREMSSRAVNGVSGSGHGESPATQVGRVGEAWPGTATMPAPAAAVVDGRAARAAAGVDVFRRRLRQVPGRADARAAGCAGTPPGAGKGGYSVPARPSCWRASRHQPRPVRAAPSPTKTGPATPAGRSPPPGTATRWSHLLDGAPGPRFPAGCKASALWVTIPALPIEARYWPTRVAA